MSGLWRFLSRFRRHHPADYPDADKGIDCDRDLSDIKNPLLHPANDPDNDVFKKHDHSYVLVTPDEGEDA